MLADDCLPCEAGSACVVKGSTAVSALCGAGYFCTSAATSTTPGKICKNYDNAAGTCSYTSDDGATCPDGGVFNAGDCDDVPANQSVCPQGFWCGKGVTEPTACNDGEFSTSYGAIDDSFCIDCSPGFYCQGFDARTECEPGYFCPEKTSDYTVNPALEGFFTEAGFSD